MYTCVCVCVHTHYARTLRGKFLYQERIYQRITSISEESINWEQRRRSSYGYVFDYVFHPGYTYSFLPIYHAAKSQKFQGLDAHTRTHSRRIIYTQIKLCQPGDAVPSKWKRNLSSTNPFDKKGKFYI